MKHCKLLVTICVFLLISAEAFSISPAQGSSVIVSVLKPIRQQYKLPAVAAAIVNAHGIVMDGVVGVRKNGTAVGVTLNDKWMIGSNLKAMTATLVGRLVDMHKLQWRSTISAIFPKLSKQFTPEFRTITVEELLSQHAGLPANLPGLTLDPKTWKALHSNVSLVKQRLQVLKYYGKRKLLYKPGTYELYSNVGYIIVGAIIDKVTGMSYEQAIKKYLFIPLNMYSASFNRGNIPGKITQPFSHFYTGKPTTITLPHVMNSDGARIYMTINDWGKFIADQIRGAEGKKALLAPVTYKKIQTALYPNQALGFEIKNGNLYHTGTDLLNVAISSINLKKGFAVLFCTNIGFNIKTAPENDDDIPVVKAGLSIIKQLSEYYEKHHF